MLSINPKLYHKNNYEVIDLHFVTTQADNIETSYSMLGLKFNGNPSGQSDILK